MTSGGGSIGSTRGLYKAPATAGSATIQAASGEHHGHGERHDPGVGSARFWDPRENRVPAPRTPRGKAVNEGVRIRWLIAASRNLG